LLNGAIVLALSIAETAITFAYLAGTPTPGDEVAPLLPAAAISRSSLFHAALHMASSALGALAPPRLMLRTLIRRLMHQSIPEISQLQLPLPPALSTLTA
jgi:hypothetical protein